MNEQPRVASRADLLVSLLSALLLACLLLPALGAAHSASDRAFCMQQMKRIILALHNHHDTRRQFPLSSTQPLTHVPGSSDSDEPAGYSWLFAVTPYMEEGAYYKAVEESSNKLQTPPFATSFETPIGDGLGAPAAYPLPGVICPASGGESRVLGDHDYAFQQGQAPAITSYHAFASSHFANLEGPGRFWTPEQIESGGMAYEGNGAFPFPGRVAGKLVNKGIGFKNVTDGTSKTFGFTESRESSYAAWIDGQAVWVVGAWPGNPDLPVQQERLGIGWPEEVADNNFSSIGAGDSDSAKPVYLAADRWSGAHPRQWGPSSNHPGVVGHAFLDGSVHMMSSDIDPTTYVRTVTRAGHEVVDFDKWKDKETATPTPTQSASGRPLTALQQRRLRGRANQPAIRMAPEAWESISWSPLRIGDLELAFPEALDLQGFRLRPDDRNIAECQAPSTVFESVTFDRQASEFRFVVGERYADSAASRLYKQLSSALGEEGEKRLDATPKQAVWRKSESWEGNSGAFEFVLVEAHEGEPPVVVIRVLEGEE